MNRTQGLSAAVCALFFLGCGARPTLDRSQLPDDSTYQLESVWKDQDGVDFQLIQASGKIQIVAMVYTNCPNICPMIVADLMRVETQVPVWRRNSIGFLLISIDPDRDTPAVTKAFLSRRKLNTKYWRFLTGKKSDIVDLSSVLGVKLDKLPDGNFAHTRILTVLSANGRIVQQSVAIEPSQLNWGEWLGK